MSGKLLVTGASGLVGANLVRLLLEQGRNVSALVHQDRRALNGLDLEILTADVRDQPALERVMVGVEVVYHLAGSISLMMDSNPQLMETNVLGTRHVVAACLRCGVRRLVHFSSIDALQKQPFDLPVDENRPLVDIGVSAGDLSRLPPYDISKARAEREALAGLTHGLEVVIIRPTAMLGPFDFKPSYLGQALIQLATGKIPALVTGGFDWVDVRDAVAGAIRAEQTASSGEIFMLSGHWHTIRQVAQLVSSFSNRPAPFFTVPFWLAYAFAPLMLRLAHFNGTQPIYTRVTIDVLRGIRQVNSDKARRMLGHAPRPLAATVNDTLAWFQEHGYLQGAGG